MDQRPLAAQWQILFCFEVPGRPRPAGSHFVVMRRDKPVVLSSGRVRSWQLLARDSASESYPLAGPIDGPIALEVIFSFSWPKTAFRGGKREEAKLKKTAPYHYCGLPDVDKLLRALCDSLTGVVFWDDKQVVRVTAEKRYELVDRTEVTVLVPSSTLIAAPVEGR